MGNCNGNRAGKRYISSSSTSLFLPCLGFLLMLMILIWVSFYRIRSKFVMREQMDSMSKHEGIKTVKVDNLCNFSRNSDLCVCIVTWNMNGKVKVHALIVVM